MVKIDALRSHSGRLVVFGGIALALLVLALAIVAGSGQVGATRGTSEAVGYYSTVRVRAQVQAAAVAQGQTETLLVQTVPNAHLAYTISFTGSTVVLKGTGQANASGLLKVSFTVPVGPAAKGSPLLGMVLVRATDPGVVSQSLITFRVYPPLHLKVTAQASRVNGSTQIVVSVQLAAKATVLASVVLPGAKSPAATARAAADGQLPVMLTLTSSALQSPAKATVTVTVTTVDGVRDTRTIAVVVPK